MKAPQVPFGQGIAFRLIGVLSASLLPLAAQTLDFSLTGSSPKVPAPFSASDIIESGGINVRRTAGELGADGAGADVGGLSYGQSEAADLNTLNYFYKRIAWSVDPLTDGVGAPIASEATNDGAAGDTFALDFVRFGNQRIVLRRPFTLAKAQTRNLTVKAGVADPEDDIDALALSNGGAYPIYLTFAPGSGFDPAAIYIVTIEDETPTINVFASATQLGLVAGDVIDAFSLGTIPFGGPPPHVLGPNMVIWISLAAGAPSRGAVDEITQIWPAPRETVLTAADLNLDSNDEINAIAVLDPIEQDLTGTVTSVSGDELRDQSCYLGNGFDSFPAEVTIATALSKTTPNGTGCRFTMSRGTWTSTEAILAGVADCVPSASGGSISALACAAGDNSVVGGYVANTTLEWSPGGGGPNVSTPGTHLSYYAGAGLLHQWTSQISPANMNFARGGLSVLQESPGNETLCLVGSVNAQGLHYGGIDIDNGGEGFRDVVAALASIGESGPDGIAALHIKGVGLSDSTDEYPQAAAAQITDGPDGPKYYFRMALDTTASGLEFTPLTKTGAQASFSINDLTLSSDEDPIWSTFLLDIEYQADTWTVHSVTPLVPIGSAFSDVTSLTLTANATYASIYSDGTYSMAGGTYGSAGTESNIFKLDFSPGSPQVLARYRTSAAEPGRAVVISATAWNPVSNTIGANVDINRFSDGAPFNYSIEDPLAEDHSGFGGRFSQGTGSEPHFIALDANTCAPTGISADMDTVGYAALRRSVPLGRGFLVGGTALTSGVTFHPYNKEFTPSTGGPACTNEKVFQLYVGPTVVGLGPMIQIQYAPPNQVQVAWFGSKLLYNDDLSGVWTEIEDASKPFLYVISGPAKFFRAE